tara:strand:+ start:10671 stop:11906 length:1236 start_codon:yes stop_codon:yes gene_type:complete
MNKPKHIDPLVYFSQHENCLAIAAQTPIELDQFERPFYVYSKQRIKQKLVALRATMPASIQLHYAVKANPMADLVAWLSPHCDGLDVASGGELQNVLNLGIAGENISFAGPGKSLDELKLAIESDCTLNIESETELKRVINLSQHLKKTAHVALRLNPDFELKSSGMQMAGGAKPFGVDAETALPILEKILASGLNFRGIQIYAGSQNLSANAINEAMTQTFALGAQLSQELGRPLPCFNVGGGFGVPYFAGQEELDLAAVGQHLHTLMQDYASVFAETDIILELGRYLVADAGVYLCKITDKKISRGETFLIANGGLHHSLAASGNFGQVIRKNYPVLIANKLQATDNSNLEKVTIVGPLCTPLDILAKHIILPKADIGDYVAVFQTGAYGYSASPKDFLGHPAAHEILL